MDVNLCLNCVSNCCKLTVDVSKDEYQIFQSKGMHGNFIKQSDKFLIDNPQHKDKIKQIDSLYLESYAELKKDKDGFCSLLNKITKLCTIYEDRPKACKDYKTTSKSCKKLRLCIY